MLKAGVNKVHRDLILGHALTGMDRYYLAVDDESLKQAMELYTEWLDEQLEAARQAEEEESKVKIPLQS
jgi:hypothetical protein